MNHSEGIVLELRKFVAPEFIFGIDSRKLAGKYLKNLGGKKALLVTDPGIINAKWHKDIIDRLEYEKVEFRIFDTVTPNPKQDEVMTGADIFRSENCDAIIALGGGSVIDCAKGIGIVSTNNKHILEFEGVDKVPVPMPPIVCIPTTGGTSADVSQFAIINNTNEKVKIAIISKSVVPDVALIDPLTLITMDPYLTACTGMDALVHAIEAFVSNASSNITDLNALEAIKLISENLIQSVKNPDNIELRGKIMLASLLAGLAFSNASLGCVHAMAHSLGGFLDLPHGECNSMLLQHVINYNYECSNERYDNLGELIGLNLKGLLEKEKKTKVLEKINQFKLDVGITHTLGKRGVKSSDIPILAGKAIKDPCNATNPRKPNKRDLEVIYEEAM
jgi:alcohol dehydrogenase